MAYWAYSLWAKHDKPNPQTILVASLIEYSAWQFFWYEFLCQLGFCTSNWLIQNSWLHCAFNWLWLIQKYISEVIDYGFHGFTVCLIDDFFCVNGNNLQGKKRRKEHAHCVLGMASTASSIFCTVALISDRKVSFFFKAEKYFYYKLKSVFTINCITWVAWLIRGRGIVMIVVEVEGIVVTSVV